MAKPNYQFEKRQRELKKAKQQEEKRLKKLADKAAGIEPGAADADTDTDSGEPTTPEQTP